LVVKIPGLNTKVLFPLDCDISKEITKETNQSTQINCNIRNQLKAQHAANVIYKPDQPARWRKCKTHHVAVFTLQKCSQNGSRTRSQAVTSHN